MSLRPVRGSRHRRVTTVRCSRPTIDHLELRALLSTTVAHPTFVIGPFAGGGRPRRRVHACATASKPMDSAALLSTASPARAAARRSPSSMPTTTRTSSPI